tara:strand:+ start:1841 stop:2005 length:165 start_codon:yes stop_codon:yes gene_type:complete
MRATKPVHHQDPPTKIYEKFATNKADKHRDAGIPATPIQKNSQNTTIPNSIQLR